MQVVRLCAGVFALTSPGSGRDGNAARRHCLITGFPNVLPATCCLPGCGIRASRPWGAGFLGEALRPALRVVWWKRVYFVQGGSIMKGIASEN